MYFIIQICSGITRGRVLDRELLCTEILEVNLFAFAYRLFHDFSPIYEANRLLYKDFSPIYEALLEIVNWREIFMKQSVGKCK